MMTADEAAKAPWEAVPASEQLFVLVTGANSGVGIGFCHRLIDEFVATRPRAAHLVLIPTTRTAGKSRAAHTAIRAHMARSPTVLRARAAGTRPDGRVHLIGLELDLCDLPGLYALTDRLCTKTVDYHPYSDPPTGTDVADTAAASAGVVAVRIPRLDAVVLNAGVGGWTGLDWGKALLSVVTKGIIASATWPDYKVAHRGTVLQPLVGDGQSPAEPIVLGDVFCANVFGHYILAHELMPLLSRPAGDSSLPRGRIIWTSSVEALSHCLGVDDVQGLLSPEPYECSKRLTDVLSLTHALPTVTRHSDGFFGGVDGPCRPRMYLTHPGIVASTLFPLPWLLFFVYQLTLYVARWLGSPWHVVTGYAGACAPVWATLRGDDELHALSGERVKWGSSCGRAGWPVTVKHTEVDDWGWQGRLEDRDALAADPAVRELRKLVGRCPDAVDLTQDKLDGFAVLGVRCWQEMERLRAQVEGLLRPRVDRHGIQPEDSVESSVVLVDRVDLDS